MSVDDFIDGLPDSYDSWNDTYRVDFFRDNLNGFNSLPNETQVLKIIKFIIFDKESNQIRSEI